MDICIWSPDWGLASVDFECLSMIAYAKFSGAPVNIKETNSPFWSSSGRLPVFRSNSSEDSSAHTTHSTITDLKEFIAHLRKKKFSADYNLSPKQQSEVRYILIFRILPPSFSPPLIPVSFKDLRRNFRQYVVRIRQSSMMMGLHRYLN